LGSERLVLRPLVEPGVVNVFASLFLGRGSVPAARRIEHVFFLSDGSERLARRPILKGLGEIWPKALLATALSALLIVQQLPRARGGIEQWTGMELLRAPIAEPARIDLLVDYLLGTSAAAQRERTTPLRDVIYLRELLRVRGVIEETWITNYLWNNVRGENYHFSAPALARLLQGSDDSDERRFSAWALGRVKAPPELAVPLLLAALADDSPKIRISALQSLALVAPDARPEVVAALVAATRDPDPGVVRIALFALRETRELPVDTVLPVAVDLLTHEDYYLRHEAANVLASLQEGALPALAQLIAALRDPEEIVRNSAAAAIAAIGQAAAPAVPELTAALQDPESDTRMFAARALGAIGPAAAAALPALEAARDERSEYTKREIESAIRLISRP
jgi:HEAT repeat protein